MDSLSKLVPTGFRCFLYFCYHVFSSFSLVSSKISELQYFLTRLIKIYDSELFHFFADFSMCHKDRSENVIKHEKLLCEVVLHFFSLLLQNISSPHSDDFPSFEITKELLVTDLLIEISFY